MSASFYSLMKYAKLGIASPEMTYYDRLKASALFGGTAPDKTITGVPPLTLNAKKAGAATSYKLTGKTVQNGTPTPDAPIEINGIGDRTVNLWDEDYTGISGNLKYVPVFVGDGTFTLSTDTSDYSGNAPLFLLSGNVTSGASTPINGVYNVISRTTDSSNGYITIAFRRQSESSNPATHKTMLNLGSTAIPYGYKATITSNGATAATLYTDKPLYGTGDVLDEYDSTGKIVRKWGVYQFTGEENVSVPNTDQPRIPCGIEIDNILIGGLTTNIIVSHFIVNSSSEHTPNFADTYTARKASGTKQIWLMMCREFFQSEITSENAKYEFKSYLQQQYAAGTPVTVIYPLATPTEETITAPPLMLAKGVNVIDVDTTVKPSSMSITGQIK